MKELYFIAAFLAMRKIKGKNENLWREDMDGRVIYRNAYQNVDSEFGWDVIKVNEKFEAINFNTLPNFDEK